MLAEASRPFEAILESGISGLVGMLTVKVVDNDGAEPIAATTSNITEIGVSGVYVWNAPAAPDDLETYTILWSTDGSFDDETTSAEPLVVIGSLSEVLPPTPSFDGADAISGPCTMWVTGDDVAECCSAAVEEVGTFTNLLDEAAYSASQLLYELSGRQFVGLCSRTVRPCHSGCGCGWQVLSRGHIVNPWGDSWDCEGRACGCQDLSRVRLSGYVREVTQVKIDGDVVDSGEYRVDENRWLTRLNGERWPSCARLDLPDTDDGTFSVTYTYGKPVPYPAAEAAKQLACQVFMQCSGSGNGSADCVIPAGATRITRQGITIERALFGRDPATKAWATGLPAVDYFLNTYNPHGLRRRALFFGPGRRNRHARPVG